MSFGPVHAELDGDWRLLHFPGVHLLCSDACTDSPGSASGPATRRRWDGVEIERVRVRGHDASLHARHGDDRATLELHG